MLPVTMLNWLLLSLSQALEDNMIRSTIVLAAIVVGLVSVSLAPAVHAQYEFTSLYSGADGLSGFAIPAINDAGVVTFGASLNNRRAIFSGNGSALTTIAAEGDTFDNTTFAELGRFPSINDCGTVVFEARLATEVQGVYTGNGGVQSIVADTSGPIRPNLVNDFGVANINNFGTVVFAAGLDEGGSGTFAGANGSITQLLSSAASSASVNDSGTIAYDINGDLFTQQGDTVTNLTANEPRFTSLFSADINDSGATAFAFFRGGVSGIAIANSEGVNIVGDNSGDFASLGLAPAINDSGDIAFLGNLDGTQGLFVGGDPVNDRVILEGDPLFGSTLSDIQFFRNGFNNRGQIAFRYSLANGLAGIAVATAVPQPGAGVLQVGLCPGDLDFNGVVDFGDIAPFIAILLSGIYEREADFDFDGAVTFQDIPLFIEILSSQRNQ